MAEHYIGAFNQTSFLDTQAVYTGAADPQYDVTNSTQIDGTACYLAEIQDSFKYYTTTLSGDANHEDGIVGAGNFGVIVKPVLANTVLLLPSAGTGAWTPHDSSDIRTAYQEMNQHLALGVFGSRLAADLFSNSEALIASTQASIEQCYNAVLDNNTALPVIEMTNGLIKRHPERFQLKYNAVVAPGAFDSTTSYFKNLRCIGASGAVARVEAAMSASDTVTSIKVVEFITDGNEHYGKTYSAIDFVLNEDVTITDAAEGTDVHIECYYLPAAIIADLNSGADTGAFDAAIAAAVQPRPDPSVSNVFAIVGTATMGVFSGLYALSGAVSIMVTISLDPTDSTRVLNLRSTGLPDGGLFLQDERLAISDIQGSAELASIAALNSVQVAMLNNTLNEDDEAVPHVGTRLPLEAGDKLVCVFSIKSHASQVDAANIAVKVASTARYVFTIQANP